MGSAITGAIAGPCLLTSTARFASPLAADIRLRLRRLRALTQPDFFKWVTALQTRHAEVNPECKGAMMCAEL